MSIKEQEELEYMLAQYMPLNERLSYRRKIARAAYRMSKENDPEKKNDLWNKFKAL